MNRALSYFGGKKAMMIPFLVFLGLYSIETMLQNANYISIDVFGLFPFLGVLVFLAVLYGMWLRVSKKILVVGVCVSAALHAAFYLYVSSNFGGIKVFFCYLIYLIPHVMVIFLLTYQKKKSPAMKEVFLVLDVLTLLSQFIPSILLFHIVIPLDVISSVILTGVMTFLWLPLEMFRICPSCGFRNDKNAGFCGGCGSRL